MPCIRCDGLEKEVETGFFDEVLCTFCGQHHLKSTNHSGPWKVYVVTDCDCRNALADVKTDKYRSNIAGITHEYRCMKCMTRYVWSGFTGWELSLEHIMEML